jgi:S1-C subfamily serine protease
MRKILATLVVLVLFAGIPALAGEGHKCKAGTQDCLNKMAADMENKGLIGVDGEWDEKAGGFWVMSYIEGTHAQQAGVEINDLLVAINGIALSDEAKTRADRGNRTPGSEVSLTVLRDGKKKKMKVTLTALTDEQMARYIGGHMLNHATVAQND